MSTVTRLKKPPKSSSESSRKSPKPARGSNSPSPRSGKRSKSSSRSGKSPTRHLTEPGNPVSSQTATPLPSPANTTSAAAESQPTTSSQSNKSRSTTPANPAQISIAHLIPPAPSAISKYITRRDRMAWAMQKAGDEPARIAEKLKCTTEEIEHLIRNFESARAELSQDMIGMVVNAEVLTAMSGVGGRLRLAQQATRFTGAYDAENNPVMAPDHQTALEAIKVTGELAERVMPKSGGGINIGINNAPGNGNGNGGGGTSFEAMVRPP